MGVEESVNRERLGESIWYLRKCSLPSHWEANESWRAGMKPELCFSLKVGHRSVQPFGVSGPHRKNNCLGPHFKYTNTNENWWAKKKVLSKFTVLCWAAFIATLGHLWCVGHRLDTPVALAVIKMGPCKEGTGIRRKVAPIIGTWARVSATEGQWGRKGYKSNCSAPSTDLGSDYGA